MNVVVWNKGNLFYFYSQKMFTKSNESKQQPFDINQNWFKNCFMFNALGILFFQILKIYIY